MKIILDFDRVIFNTKELSDRMKAAEIEQRDANTLDRLTAADPSFVVENLLFPNAKTFLETYGQHCIILSSATADAENPSAAEQQMLFQELKLAQSGIANFVGTENIKLVPTSKKATLAELHKQFGSECVFVDDKEEFLREAADVGIEAIWMDREQKAAERGPEGMPTLAEFQRVRNFAELAPLLVERISRSIEPRS